MDGMENQKDLNWYDQGRFYSQVIYKKWVASEEGSIQNLCFRKSMFTG